MKILSLFDGMACGAIAFTELGIPIDRYVAYEIDKYAIQAATHNFPFIEEKGDVFNADFTEYKGFDWIVGGSPCTYWSIAQKNNRETEASGMGWELFSQYVRAIKEAQPKYFLYENNKSMSKAIRASITDTFGFEPICINSALVSAQNRQRLYWVGIRQADGTYRKANIEQPADRGILLKDILQTGSDLKMVAEPINTTKDGKSQCVRSTCYKDTTRNLIANDVDKRTCVAEPVNVTDEGKSQTIKAQYQQTSPRNICCYTSTFGASGVAEPVGDTEGKAFCLTSNYNGAHMPHTVEKSVRSMCAEPIRVGALPRPNGELSTSQAFRVYGTDGKSVNINAGGGGAGGKTGLYAIPVEWNGDIPIKGISQADGKTYTVYEVKDGQITIKDKQYPIKLKDGYYIIRKLTVLECMRLQTVPEWYEFSVSNSQAYKMLGNGWTCAVIEHLISSTLENEDE